MKTQTTILRAWDSGFKFPVLNEAKQNETLKLALKFLGLDKSLKSKNMERIENTLNVIIEILNGGIGDFEFIDNYREIYMDNSKIISQVLQKYSYDASECFYSDIVQDMVAHFIITALENFANKKITYNDFSEHYSDSVTLANGEKVIVLKNDKANKEQEKQDKKNHNSLVYNMSDDIPTVKLSDAEVEEINRIATIAKSDFVLYNGYICTWGKRGNYNGFFRLHNNTKRGVPLLSFFNS